jgi:hypothetical protein
MLLKRQNPIATEGVAWWPGGRTEQSCITVFGIGDHRIDRGDTRTGGAQRGFGGAFRQHRVRVERDAVRDRRIQHQAQQGVVVHAQQLPARRARSIGPGHLREGFAQRRSHRFETRGAFGMSRAGVVLEAGGVSVEVQGRQP